MLGPEEMEIDEVDTFTSAGPSVHESSLVAVHEFKVHSTVRLVPFFKTASALQWQGTSTSSSAYHNDGFASGPPHEPPPHPLLIEYTDIPSTPAPTLHPYSPPPGAVWVAEDAPHL